MRRDFYFSASEATGSYFVVHFVDGLIREYESKQGLIWATEVTAPGERPLSRSKDLLLVASNVEAEFIGTRKATVGRLWDALNITGTNSRRASG